jgi:hypothetical protein
VIVALVWVVGLVDRAWILAPVMAVQLVLTVVVLVAVARLLDDQ